MKRNLLALAFGLALLAPFGVAAQAVSRVVVVETDDVPAYVEAIAEGQALIRAAGSNSTLRVWRAQFAGASVGTVVVTIDYPSMSALGEDMELMAASADLQGWLASLDDIRTLLSDSIYSDITAP